MPTDPHTLAYMLATLRGNGEHEAADALMSEHAIPLVEPERKAMSAYAASAGGALVPPAGSSCDRRKRRKRALVAKILKGLE